MTRLIRQMSILRKLPKLASFTDSLLPDNIIRSKEIATENKDNLIRTPRVLHDGAFSWSLPEQRKEYLYLTSSSIALEDLGLGSDPEKNDYREIVSGQVYCDPAFISDLPFPYSQAYAGWQFGQFAGQLGDGRVHNLFEISKSSKARDSPSCTFTLSSNIQFNRSKYEVQLKGSGKTPYSRFADGKAVLRSSIREYIISEHLNRIGIPSTRALALTYLPKTYAQRHAAEKCAIVARFAELWVRLGNFDLYRWRSDVVGVRDLSQYVIDELFTMDDGSKFPYFVDLLKSKNDFFDGSSSLGENLTDFDKMYFEIVIRNATTTALWQSYGFLNGVLNTDNTSVLGLSMDFGPFSIMDQFDPKYSPNSEDHQLRYSYENTPTSIWWNLNRLGEDLAHLIGAGEELIEDPDFKKGKFEKSMEEKLIKRATKIIEIAGDIYQYAFTKRYVETFFGRLGMPLSLISKENPDAQNSEVIVPLLQMLRHVKCDFNKFFLLFRDANLSPGGLNGSEFAQVIVAKQIGQHDRYTREELVEMVEKWVQVYHKALGDEKFSLERSSSMNPLFLPRNWILDEVITKTQESGGEDLTYLHKLEKMAFHPFDPTKWGDELKDFEELWVLQGDKGEMYTQLQCSCAS